MDKPTTLLLADDHEVVRSGIRNALRELTDFEIIGEVGNGTALKAALAALEPDCLLVDIAMPALRPIEDMRHIRKSYPSLKILVVSAHDDDEYVQGLLAAGVNGYHLKDQPLSDLRLAVQRVAAGQRWVTGRLLDKLLVTSTPQPDKPRLTQRQKEILSHLRSGSDNQTIARQSGLSVKTVENHLTRIYRLLGVQSRLEAANYVMDHPHLLGGEPENRPISAKPELVQNILEDHPNTILIVDDNVRFRQQLRRTVAHIFPHAHVVEAGTIKEAVVIARQTRPRLSLVDVVLGSENGIECARRLSGLDRPPRIVLMTAYPDREFHRMGLKAGAAALIDKKDLDAQVLRQIIEDVI